MKYILSLGVVILNLLVIVYACGPLFTTFAQLPVYGVAYNIGDQASIERALSEVRSKTIEEMRMFWSQFIWPLAGLACMDTTVIVTLILRRPKTRRLRVDATTEST